MDLVDRPAMDPGIVGQIRPDETATVGGMAGGAVLGADFLPFAAAAIEASYSAIAPGPAPKPGTFA